jgi:hypothetical protein
MSTHRFVIDGPLKGYRAGLDKVWDKDEKLAYDRWKGIVRLQANLAGIPDTIEPGVEIGITVRIGWTKKARIDGSNILKSVEDALFERDRKLESGLWTRTENVGREFATVDVTVNRKRKETA